MLPADLRDAPGSIGEWSPKDVLAHITAWRAIEARRLDARAGKAGPQHASDPGLDDPVDESNARLHAHDADLSWEAVQDEADASAAALVESFGRTSFDILCECPEGIIAGNGVNAANHAMAHLSDVAQLTGGASRYEEYVREVESIVRRGHVPPRDAGVILYNIACHFALAGQLDEARRLIRAAFRQRRDLLEPALGDPDLEALAGELPSLAATG
jgi:hypothetical protein